jgi:pimeloyl-ACP methyl ester carboxylesterase
MPAMTRTELLMIGHLTQAGLALLLLLGCSGADAQADEDRMMKGPVSELFVDDGGPGNGDGGLPVVFIHSASGAGTHWAAQLKHLRQTRRAVAIDLRGHGRSSAPANGDYAIASMADDIGAVADQLGLGRFVLVGHSMGGFVAIAYAGAHPDRVAGLFLLDPASDGRLMPAEQAAGLMGALRSDAYQATVEGYWESIIGNVPAVRDQLMADLHATPRETMIGTLENLLSFDPVTPLRVFHGPKRTLITVFNETPASLQNLVPDLPCEKIENTGHWPQLEMPAEINRRLDLFLAASD